MPTDRAEHTSDAEVERGLFFPLIAIAQAATSTVPQKLDLTTLPQCETHPPTDDDIIVCGRRDTSSQYRIKPLSTRESYIPKAETQLADGVGVSAETERVDIGGMPSNRVMIRLKFKF